MFVFLIGPILGGFKGTPKGKPLFQELCSLPPSPKKTQTDRKQPPSPPPPPNEKRKKRKTRRKRRREPPLRLQVELVQRQRAQRLVERRRQLGGGWGLAEEVRGGVEGAQGNEEPPRLSWRHGILKGVRGWWFWGGGGGGSGGGGSRGEGGGRGEAGGKLGGSWGEGGGKGGNFWENQGSGGRGGWIPETSRGGGGGFEGNLGVDFKR